MGGRRARTGIAVSALCCAAALAAASAQGPESAAGWPMFRGSAALTGVAGAPLGGTLSLRWSYEAKDSIESSAAIAGGTVYVGSMDGRVHAVDLGTGKARWLYHTTSMIGESSPCVRDGRVYVGDLDGVVQAIDAANDKARWTFKTERENKS